MPPRYAKEMPGAKQVLCPGDLDEYAGYAWDIRISLANEPLDEAYYCTVESLGEADRSVRELLEDYALNPARESELDLDHYPDLPFLREVLGQYYEAARKGQLTLRVFVNQLDGELDLDLPAREVLASCTFRNRSWDYLVLDLIFETEAPQGDSDALDQFIARHQNLSDRDTLRAAADELAVAYEKYASVAVAPCALGVPDGFDVRLQMMELDGLDPERCVLTQLLADSHLELAECLEPVCEALAFKTNFTSEILNELKAFENT